MQTRLDEVLKAAGEPTRLRILNLLRLGPACVCELQAVLQIPQPTISRHLSSLRSSGLVTCVRTGTRVSYSLARSSSPMVRILRRVLDDGCPREPWLRKDVWRLERRAGRSVGSTEIHNNQGGRS